MFSIIQKRRWYYLFSALIILPGLAIMVYSLITTGALFRLGTDFVGGSIYEIQFLEDGATEFAIQQVFQDNGDSSSSVQQLGEPEERRWSVRASFEDNDVVQQIIAGLAAIAPIDEAGLRIEQISPTIGQEVTQAAFIAVLVAAVVVIGFIVIAFRQVPNALQYGFCAIAAMIHDILVVSAFASLMGLLLGWEVDALFLTALLTVVGFSIQDTIVLFDRIRENIPKHLGEPYETIINRSILETIHRSLATQLNAFFIMIAILLFGGDSIKQFIAVLFVGLLTGTYSSIFIAVPLLISIQKGEIPFFTRRSTTIETASPVSS